MRGSINPCSEIRVQKINRPLFHRVYLAVRRHAKMNNCTTWPVSGHQNLSFFRPRNIDLLLWVVRDGTMIVCHSQRYIMRCPSNSPRIVLLYRAEYQINTLFMRASRVRAYPWKKKPIRTLHV